MALLLLCERELHLFDVLVHIESLVVDVVHCALYGIWFQLGVNFKVTF